MSDFAIANRLHRAGAIDYNVEFATRHATMLKDRKSSDGKRLYALCPDDGLSVCEGEPIYTPKRHKGNHYSSVDSCRNPISCISSLNGFAQGISQQALLDIGEDGRAVPIKWDSNPAQILQTVQAHEAVRDKFFAQVHPMGVAVSKWVFPKLGHQQDQYVGTLGGMNTIYCDTDCQAGDTLVVDMPFPTEDTFLDMMDKAKPGTNHPNPWGFIECVKKKGCPREKVTLVVRPLPDIPRIPNADRAQALQHRIAYESMRSNFERRGQILGRCTRGAKKGERVDLCLQANAICGSVNMNDFGPTLMALQLAADAAAAARENPMNDLIDPDGGEPDLP